MPGAPPERYRSPKEGQIPSWLPNLAFSGAHKWAERLYNSCSLGGPQRKTYKIRIGCLNPAFMGAHKWAEMLHNPCILGDPPTNRDKIKIGNLTPAFWGAHKWPEPLHASVRWTKQTLPPKKGGGSVV